MNDVLSGYNGTIFAYGQSGSGKTYTMYGDNIYDENNRGIIPRLINDIFEFVENADENITFQFKMSILQIYKENIYDLLTGENNLKIKENPIRGIYVDKLTEVYIDSFETFMEYIDISQENRIVSETKLNSLSSRSHSILIFEITQNLHNENFSKKGILNLVDLAGSEKISKTGAIGETLKETKKINLSLSALGNVIHALTTNSDHIPYRDSKLTRILQESLGGNFKTSLIVTCSPHSYHFDETNSSLKFAQRVKFIKNKVKINIKLTYEELQKINGNLRKELGIVKIENKKLRDILASNNIEFIIDNKVDDNEIKDEESKNLIVCKSTFKGTKKNLFFPKKSTGNLITNSETDLLSKTQSQSKFHFNYDSNENFMSINNCFEHNKIIKQLKQQIEELNNEIKEKDNIISSLEENNRKKQKDSDNKEIKDNNVIFNNEIKDAPRILKDLEKIYKEIKDEMIKIEKTYEEIKIQKDIKSIISNFETLINNSIKKNNVNNSIENIKQLSSIIINNLNSNENIEDKIKELTNKYEKNISELYNDLLDISDKTEMKYKLFRHSTFFIYGYIESVILLNLNSQLNQKLISENNILIESNNILLKIIENILKSNLDISNKINNTNYQNLTKSIIENKFNVSFVNEPYKLSFIETYQPSNYRHYRRNKSKIMTLINRKGLDMLKKQKKNNNELIEGIKHKRQHSTQLNLYNTYNELLINKNLYSSSTNKTNNPIPVIMESLSNEKNNSIQDEDKIIENLRNVNLNINDTRNENSIKIDESFMKNSFKGEKIFIPISEMEPFEFKQEKKKSKLNMLKDFIIKSLKETENYKKDIIVLKTVFVNLLEEQLKLIMNKLYEKNIFNENEIKVLNKTFGTIDIDKLISESNDKILKIEDLNELENSFENVNNIISSKNSELKIKNKNDRNSKKKNNNCKTKKTNNNSFQLLQQQYNSNNNKVKNKKNKNFINENDVLIMESKEEMINSLKKSMFGNMKKPNEEVKLVANEEILSKSINHKNSNYFNFYKNTNNSLNSKSNKTTKNAKKNNSDIVGYNKNKENSLSSNKIIEEKKNQNGIKTYQDNKNKPKFTHQISQSQNIKNYIKNIKKNSFIDSPRKNTETFEDFPYLDKIENKIKIEDLVADYLMTGTATRRFDGIGITFKNQKIKCLFRGGLSANNSLDITPVGKCIKSLNGDDDNIPNPEL